MTTRSMRGRTTGRGSSRGHSDSSTTCRRRASRRCTRRRPVRVEGGDVHRADYVIKRMAFALMTVFVAITINFILFRALPGSAVSNFSRAPHASPELRATLTHEFGLDQPLWKQYVLYLDQLIVHRNMGVSFADNQPVTTALAGKLETTFGMVFVDRVCASLIGIV